MFLCRNLIFSRVLWRRNLICSDLINNVVLNHQNYSALSAPIATRSRSLPDLHIKWYSTQSNGDENNDFNVKHAGEIKKIRDVFPEARVALHNFACRIPGKSFTVYYRQDCLAPKKRSKGPRHNGWSCTYAFSWPESITFAGNALSKSQAAENAATRALYWLYMQRKIDAEGYPVYDSKFLNEVKNNLDEPIVTTISDKTLEKAEEIWQDYQGGIKKIYEDTFKDAEYKIIQTQSLIIRDSSIDEDDISDNEECAENVLEIKQRVHPVYGRNITDPNPSTLARRNSILHQLFQRYHEELTPLPIDNYREQITSTLDSSRVAVIVGAPGCGKSTRVPAAILQHCGANTAAIVSEPRRVAAIGLAERVADELREKVGQSIGYQVRLHSKPPKPPCGSILYCTSGVLLRRLQANPGLEGCTHVVIDEAHERDVNTDVSLLLLKRALDINPELRLVIMSATLDIAVFTKYFETCPVIQVPGKTFPVQTYHLDDIRMKFGLTLSSTLENCQRVYERPHINCEEVAELVIAVDKTEKEGAILVFLPGWSEIKRTKTLLDEHYERSGIHIILPVHSRLSTEDQTKMFAVPPPGIRKIVLATNVAETSITIPDVIHVIDTGSHKETTVKEGTGTATLETVWVSMAGAKQRTGRAGRVQSGFCYRMYTKKKEETFALHTTPEMLRVPLEQTVLDCKSYAPDEKIEEFLSELPEPPSTKAIQLAVQELIEIGALTSQEHLTRLGSLLSMFSLHPRLGKSLLHSAIIGNIVSISIVAAYCANNTEIFINAAERRDEIREIKRKYSPSSDHAALYGIQEHFSETYRDGGRIESENFCKNLSVSGARLSFMNSICNLQLEQVIKTGIIPNITEVDEMNYLSAIDEVMCGVFLSGTDSLLVTKKKFKSKSKATIVNELFTSAGDRAHIASDSVNYNITKRNSKNHLLAYFGGYHSAERRALVVYKSSLVPPETVILFCPGDIQRHAIENDENITVLELPKHKLKINVPTAHADQLLRLREIIWNTLYYYIQRDVNNVDYQEDTEVAKFKFRVMNLVHEILAEGHKNLIYS